MSQFIVIVLVLFQGNLTYQNLLQTYTNLIPVRYRNFTSLQLFSLFFVLLLSHISHLCMLQIQQCLLMIVTLYNCMPFKEAGGGNDSKNRFTEFVMLTFLFNHFQFSSFVPIDSGYHLVTFAHVSIALFPVFMVVLSMYF